MITTYSSYKISTGFFVNAYEIKNTDITDEVKTRLPLNHVFCCDISGSMWSSLPKMREQLKNRLSSIVEDGDTITIIAFADAEDCVVLKDHVNCSNSRELNELHRAIDKYLVDQGCTDFLEPISRTINLIRKGERYNFVFLSDGYHNCGSFDYVIDKLKKLATDISQSTIIEYGYCADSERLSEMAELLGGSKIPSSGFDEYVPIMENVFKGGAVSPRIKSFVCDSPKRLIKPIVVYLNPVTSQVTSASIDDDGNVLLPTSVTKYWTVSRKELGSVCSSKPTDLDGLYGVAYVLADKLEYDLVEDLLYYIGDTKFINQYQSSFGKQKLFKFQNDLASAIFDKSLRGTIDPNYKVSDDRYCVIDFFNELISTEGNLVRIASNDFNYNRIGAKSVDKIILTDEEQKALSNAKSAAAAQEILDNAKKRMVKMTKIDKGYPLLDFVWNENRANLSGQFNIDVELELPENNFGLTTIRSSIFRDYTIIKDGIVNVSVLPLILTKESYNAIAKHHGVSITVQKELDNGMIQCMVDISELPVINKKKIKSCRKSEMTKLALNLTDSKFCLKYLNSLVDKKETVAALTDGYTPEQADYLASLGITSKGYNPSTESVKDGDFYLAPTINSDFKGFSSVPKISEVMDAVSANKSLKPSFKYMYGVIQRIDDFIAANLTTGTREKLIKQMIDDMTADKKMYARQLAQMKFAMLVSRKFFEGASNFDDNTDTVRSKYGLDMVIEYRFVDKKQNL